MNSDILKAHTSNTLYKYCDSLTEYSRRKTVQVNIGDIWLGSHYPIRIQSMTTVDTMDTVGSVEQTIRMVNAGCEYVRITAPSIKEAENLANIKAELRKRGYNVPLIADIHFTPNAAEVAARIVEKVRVNPGNYADKKRFETIDYTDASYAEELERIRERFIPLVKICKEYGTAMRIGTNHGSLSDRILSRYGDTPLGMVESALEFLRICEDLNYYNTVISMKASNTQVMVQAYRLLVQKLNEEGLKPYPLHLGVTEAGEGEDGRIKSAVGIGTLLEDGLGDTIRVSLTEDPEFEVPVAKALAERYTTRPGHKVIKPIDSSPINPFQHVRRKTREVLNFGGNNVPRVIMDLSQLTDIQMKDLKNVGHFYLPEPDKWKMNDLGCDYIYSGDNEISFMLPNGVREILNYTSWQNANDQNNKFPMMNWEEYLASHALHHQVNFIRINYKALHDAFYKKVINDETAVLVIDTNNEHAMAALRRVFFYLIEHNITCPVVILRKYEDLSEDKLQLYASTDIGGLLIDGLGDGVLLSTELIQSNSKEELLDLLKIYNNASFGILQAARTRMSKTEYISCPSCGRTLFDLQETTAMIRKRTDHLKGIKIGIMGCIVNGPGEMADADYGYVGVGKGKISLYRGQNVVKKFVSSDKAVDELVNLIKEDGVWKEPEEIESN
jgi:(E)-4-hydroxy-3-methylbut-2-enyl-diphosphate synthase